MAPVEPDLHTSNTLPIALFSTQIALVASLTIAVLRTIYRAARTLPPPSSTRAQLTSRKREVAVFATLAGLSLATITYCTISWRKASYLSWAEAGKFEVPGSIWSGWYGTGEGDNAQRWWLGSWLKDVGYFKEAEDLGLQVPSGVFWLDQEFLGLAVGGLFIGIEGHRRNLPVSTTVALVLLSQICGLSYALNLFFIAMIYTPIPLHRSLPPRRDMLWMPKPMVYRVPLALALVSLASVYRNANNDLAKTALRIGYFALPIYFATAIEIIPTSWGVQHHTTASAHRSLLSFFRFASLASPLFYALDTARALVDSAPSKHYTGYDYVWNMHKGGVRSPYDRVTGAISGFVMSLSRHPALSATSCDVLLAAVSMLTWSFVRGLDVDEMLNFSFSSYIFGIKKPDKHVAFEDDQAAKPVKEPSPRPTPAKKPRGRPKKNGSLSASTVSVANTSSPLRRSTRRKTVSEHESDSEDAYKPSAHTKDEIAATEHDSAEGDDLVADGEAAALGLGFYVVGGLGTLAAAVLGAEVGGI